MPHKLLKRRAVLSGNVGIEETDEILQWFRDREQEKTELDLSDCDHLHAAILQVLMIARPRLSAMPANASFGEWVGNSLSSGYGD
ncbi:hypothetical protein [Parathalassolituus penaei]|uniref:Uncharacterized protein n=1 Tax=Parathalassolituus penaei TaxID=2997323 RepID=A0A9X3EEZ3_9GAMM|nr:hypothetical protein [Parathalassolituus penaei]MCY0965524.1 hypothetical protein [Parathalassolituus penaei]